jgi:FKBP12-rapamycin complex-associated protein
VDTPRPSPRTNRTPASRKGNCDEAIVCLAQLAAAAPQNPNVQEQVPELVEQMLAVSHGTLPRALVRTLAAIGAAMPMLLPDIQLKLLDSISFTLQRTPYQPSGTPSHRRIAPLRPATGGASRVGGAAGEQRQHSVTRALEALTEFDFAGNNLSEFVKDCVAPYLEDPAPPVRLTAARTCGVLLLRAADVSKRGYSALVVNQVCAAPRVLFVRL